MTVAAPARPASPSPASPDAASVGFHVILTNFEGPFDLLLQLISRHKLDVTEVALSEVTDEFLAHIRAAGPAWDLDQTSQFVVVAATLLDLKAARLIPAGEVEDPEDLALLEARDLLFARLLQYQAYREVASGLAARLASEASRYPRSAGPDPTYVSMLPEVRLSITPERFAALAARALAPRPVEMVSLQHLHASPVSVAEQAATLAERLRSSPACTFRVLTGDSPNAATTVARFLALLELYRQGAVAVEQAAALEELTIRWVGGAAEEIAVADHYDGSGTEEAASD